jgi:carboxyl-terminal processing protease
VPDISMPSMIDTTTIGEDTYTSSLPWSTISKAFYRPTGEISQEEIGVLKKKFQDRSSKNHQYQAYLHDVNVLNQLRKKKVTSLQDSSFKSEIERIKQIEKQWIQAPDSVKSLNKDVLINQSAAIVSDIAELKAIERHTVVRTSPAVLN